MTNDKQLLEEFLQFLGEQLQAKDQKDLEKKVQSLGEEGLKKYYQAFVEHKKNKAKKAAHGAKLNYFKKLKNVCAEDEELVYYKKGGSVGCGCVKKAEAGLEMDEPKKKNKKNATVEEYKKKRQSEKTSTAKKEPKYTKEQLEQQRRNREASARGEYDETTPVNRYKVKSNCGGGFMKKSKIVVSGIK